MPIFTITYELRNNSKKHDYNALARELQSLKCFQIMQNTCLGNFANTATQVHNHLLKLLDKGDSLLVIEMYQHFAYTGRAKEIQKWLAANPPAVVTGRKEVVAQPAPAQAAPAKQPAPAKAAAAKPAAKAKAAPAKAAPKKK